MYATRIIGSNTEESAMRITNALYINVVVTFLMDKGRFMCIRASYTNVGAIN